MTMKPEENKILILYTLNKLTKAISYDSLLNLILAVTDMNYFEFQSFISDLLNNNYINEIDKDEEKFFSITDSGREALKLTSNIVPGIIKLKVDSKFKEEIETFNDAHSIIAEYEPIDENEFIVTLKIIDNDEIIFELKTIATSTEDAKKIINNWKENANTIYPNILKLLN